jgi:hypothetical protein
MLDARRAPDLEVLTEPIVGWRAWAIRGTTDGTEVRLLPLAAGGAAWTPRVPAVAVCVKRRHHRVPALDCRCGIHATHDPHVLRRTRDPAVLGRVALWGRVIEHELGYRAEFGYPQRLALLCELCFWQRGAGHAEPPEVVIRHRGGQMVPLCGPHAELSRRHGYPARRLLDAGRVERVLLDAYAVDVLRLVERPGLGAGLPAR